MEGPSNMKRLVQSVVDAHRNMLILRTLHEMDAYVSNDLVLRTIMEEYGISTTMDAMRQALDLLRREELVRIDEVEGMIKAHLTAKGEDVALGRIVNEWVARPTP